MTEPKSDPSELEKKLSKDRANIQGLGVGDASDQGRLAIGRNKTGSTTDVWITPDYILKWVHEEFGYVGLDAAADSDNSVAKHYIDEHMDALTTPWISKDIVWCNPPYGRRAKKFVQRALDEISNGHCSKVVMMLAVRTDTTMFQDLIFPNASRIHFIKGRVKFKRGAGKPTKVQRPNFASAIILFDGNRLSTDPPLITYGVVN